MATPKKIDTVETARNWHNNAIGLIFTEYSGLSVSEMQELRKNVRESGGEFRVIKNTLLRLALGQDTIEKLPNEFHNGPTATVFVLRDEAGCAKSLATFAKTHQALKIKGAFLDGAVLTDKEVDALSKLPSKQELLSMIVGLVAAPISNIVTCVNEILAGPARAVSAIAEKGGAVVEEPAKSATEEIKTEEEPQQEIKETPTESSETIESTNEEAQTETQTAETNQEESKKEGE